MLLANRIKNEHAGSPLTALSPRAVLILSLTLKAFSASARKKNEQYMMIKNLPKHEVQTFNQLKSTEHRSSVKLPPKLKV